MDPWLGHLTFEGNLRFNVTLAPSLDGEARRGGYGAGADKFLSGAGRQD